MLDINASSIQSYYLERGYRDAVVEASYEMNEADNTVQVHYTVSEGMQYKVRDILFHGISGLSARDLGDAMTQKRKTFFNSGNLVMANIETDKAAIVALYGKEGYPDGDLRSHHDPSRRCI